MFLPEENLTQEENIATYNLRQRNSMEDQNLMAK